MNWIRFFGRLKTVSNPIIGWNFNFRFWTQLFILNVPILKYGDGVTMRAHFYMNNAMNNSQNRAFQSNEVCKCCICTFWFEQ